MCESLYDPVFGFLDFLGICSQQTMLNCRLHSLNSGPVSHSIQLKLVQSSVKGLYVTNLSDTTLYEQVELIDFPWILASHYKTNEVTVIQQMSAR